MNTPSVKRPRLVNEHTKCTFVIFKRFNYLISTKTLSWMTVIFKRFNYLINTKTLSWMTVLETKLFRMQNTKNKFQKNLWFQHVFHGRMPQNSSLLTLLKWKQTLSIIAVTERCGELCLTPTIKRSQIGYFYNKVFLSQCTNILLLKIVPSKGFYAIRDTYGKTYKQVKHSRPQCTRAEVGSKHKIWNIY